MWSFRPARWVLAALSLLCATSVLAAAQFYVVVPVPKRAVPAGIEVSLTGASLPVGLIGTPYTGFNFKSRLTVTGDPSYTGYGVKWSVVSGSLPAGLTLSADGQVSGTPTAVGTASFQVQASYKTKTGEQAYQIVVGTLTVALAAGTPPQAIVGQPYAYDLKQHLTVAGDPAFTPTAVTWSVVSSSLPAGLYLTFDGWIGGTPTAGGTGKLVARAAYKTKTGEQTYEVVSLPIAVTLAKATPPVGVVGQAYSYDLNTLLAVSGDPGYMAGTSVTWSFLDNSLPEGLYLTAGGVIAGTPAAAGTGAITARATYKNVRGAQTYSITTLAISVGLGAGSPPQAIVGQAYAYDLKQLLSVTGDPAYMPSAVTWATVSNSLPAGLYLTFDGWIGGTPTAGGTGKLVAQASYKNVKGAQSYEVVALTLNVVLAAGSPPQAIVGQAYSYDLAKLLTVTGDASYSSSSVAWSLVSGNLPAGLSLNSKGLIAGTPSAAGSASFTVRASYRGVNSEHLYQVVAANLTVALAGASLPTGMVRSSYSYDFKPLVSSTGDPNYSSSAVQFGLDSGSLPAGLSLSSSGVLSGVPSATASGQVFNVTASYLGTTATKQYSITIQPETFSFSPTISGTTVNYNIRSAAVAAGWNGVTPLRANITIGSSAVVGASSTSSYAFQTGTSLPAGSSLTLTNYGAILGRGGDGGDYDQEGYSGGPAMLAQYPITVLNYGTIGGGGGGGGGSGPSWQNSVVANGAGGGGGQGYAMSYGGDPDPRAPAYTPAGSGGSGTASSYGYGGSGTMSGRYPNQFSPPWLCYSGSGGSGGALGQVGSPSGAGSGSGCSYAPSRSGGAGGVAVVGANYVTWGKTGTVRGGTQP